MFLSLIFTLTSHFLLYTEESTYPSPPKKKLWLCISCFGHYCANKKNFSPISSDTMSNWLQFLPVAHQFQVLQYSKTNF